MPGRSSTRRRRFFLTMRENTLDRLIEFRLGVIIRQEPVLNGLPIQVVEVYSLIIAWHFIAVGGKEPLPTWPWYPQRYSRRSAPVGRAARVAQVIILRLLAVAYLHLIPDDAAAIVDILVGISASRQRGGVLPSPRFLMQIFIVVWQM